MVAFNFQPRFGPLILDGRKLHTFRRTKRCDPGDKMQLFTGQRTKACILLREVVCEYVRPHIVFDDSLNEEFARADGFVDTADMILFFTEEMGYEFPIYGFLHGWKL